MWRPCACAAGFEGIIIAAVSEAQRSDGTEQQLISSGVSAMLTMPLQTAAVRNALTGKQARHSQHMALKISFLSLRVIKCVSQ